MWGRGRAILQYSNPTASIHELSARAQQIRQVLINSHPEHFQFLSEDGQVGFDANAYLDITAPGLLDSLLGAVFGQNRPQINLIYPQAEDGLLIYTLGQDNPQLGTITLADLRGHYMAAAPRELLEPSMPQFAAELGMLAPVEAVNASQTGSSAPSTIGYLAGQFSRADLIGAAIQQHNPQDFTGRPLPSGASVDSQALPTEPASSGNGNAAASQQTSQRSAGPKQLVRSTGGRRQRRPVPTLAAHRAELSRLASVTGLQAPDHSYYSAFLAHLETGPSVQPGGRAIKTLDEFKALTLADQNTLVNAAIASGLHTGTRQSINRAQSRAADQQLQGQQQRGVAARGAAFAQPYPDPGALPYMPATPATGAGFVIGEIDSDEDAANGDLSLPVRKGTLRCTASIDGVATPRSAGWDALAVVSTRP